MCASNWLRLAAVTILLTAGALACGNNDTPASPSSSTNAATPTSPGGGSASSNGTLTIHLTDSPFSDAKALLVTFSDVSVHSADPGDWKTLTFTPAASFRTCDLKQLTGATDVLGVGSLAAGQYTQIRLNVSSATLYLTNAWNVGPCVSGTITPPLGASAPVTIPSGEIKLNNEFTVASSGPGTKILLDFDGDQSVHQTGGGRYMMSPVIRLVSVQ
jgi:hypothetical protein